MYIEIKTSNYISYVDNLSLNDPLDITAILEELNPQENHIITIDNIIYGGYRGTNELHLYDSSNYRKCNSYGHEIAINQDGFVVDSKTKNNTDGIWIGKGFGEQQNFRVSKITKEMTATYPNNFGFCLKESSAELIKLIEFNDILSLEDDDDEE